MRNLSSSHGVDSCLGIPLHTPSTMRTQSVHIDTAVVNVAQSALANPVVFSQKTRGSVMRDNIREVMKFMEAQQRTLKDLIRQLQIFTGYLEQLNSGDLHSRNPHAWSVYLMHAQSLSEGMNNTYRDKPLFGDPSQNPVRIHLQTDRSVEPFDLPDPCLSSMPSLLSFLAGVSDHHLPTTDLTGACMAELLNALVEVQSAREKLSHVSKNFQCKETSKLRMISSRSLNSTQSKSAISGFLDFFERLGNLLRQMFRKSVHA